MIVKKLSGMQKEVLALYRGVLREAMKKDRLTAAVDTNTTSFTGLLFADNNNNSESSGSYGDEKRNNIIHNANDIDNDNNTASTSTAHARSEFRRQALQVSRKDFRTIEYKIRHGYKQIKLLQMPGVVTFQSW
mmetsp:Transcript_25145/g.28160  ORF Transcript_25145/g.28160 Transcript_25145/m.28160 type:complete len:133 (+) Transcript_25145:41-439(+)